MSTVLMLTCPDCGKIAESEYFDLAVFEGEKTMVCDECTSDHYRKCEGCDHWAHNDEVQDLGNYHFHAWMCGECADELEAFISESEEAWSA